MRLVHLADLHLGFRQYGRLTPSGINQREADVARAFHRTVDRVIALRPDLVVIAGDVFHSVRPMNPAIIDTYLQLERIRKAIPDTIIVMVAGNHDRPRSTETGCILKLFRALGVLVVADAPERIAFPERDLSVLAVPELADGPPALTADANTRYNVLVLHGEIAGVIPARAARGDRSTAEIPAEALGVDSWSYVALGHYHVHREIAPNAFYAGSIEYTSTDPWGEMTEEHAAGVPGKGFIEYDLDAAAHRFHRVELERRLIELPALSARGMTAAELDGAVRERIEGCEGGIDDQVVRLVVRDLPRHIAREADQRALREYKRRALHFHIDARRPEIVRSSGSGAPGQRQTLEESVKAHLARRSLAGDVDRDALVRLGLQYLETADTAEQQGDARAVGEGAGPGSPAMAEP